MSYARFGSDSDVYVYMDVGGFLRCCGCALARERFWSREFFATADLLDHLDEHKAAGHDVPRSAIARLEAEADEIDSWIESVREPGDSGV